MSDIRRRAAEGIRAGDRFTVTRTFTESDTESFARLSLDYNPIHFEPRFVAVKGFRDRICHGLLVGGMITQIGGQIGMLASGMNFRFRRPVYFGETVTCNLTVDEMDEQSRVKCSALFVNQDGEEVLEAQLYGIVPKEGEQDVLRQMESEGDPTNPLRGQRGGVAKKGRTEN